LVRAERAQTPPPDERPYFRAADWAAREDPYNPLPSECENDLYIVKFGKRKAKAWPRSNDGFEHEKAKVRKRIRRMQKHMKELKRRHRVCKSISKKNWHCNATLGITMPNCTIGTMCITTPRFVLYAIHNSITHDFQFLIPSRIPVLF